MIRSWPWRCWMRGHRPLLTQRRDATGAVLRMPHTLLWICERCNKPLGETVLVITPPGRHERGRNGEEDEA